MYCIMNMSKINDVVYRVCMATVQIIKISDTNSISSTSSSSNKNKKVT